MKKSDILYRTKGDYILLFVQLGLGEFSKCFFVGMDHTILSMEFYDY